MKNIRNFSKYLVDIHDLNNDRLRRANIFRLILSCLAILSTAMLAILVAGALIDRTAGHYQAISFYIIAEIILIALLIRSRHGVHIVHIYIFLAAYFVLITYVLSRYGYVVPQGLLLYTLLIVVSCLLIPAFCLFIVKTLIAGSLLLLFIVHGTCSGICGAEMEQTPSEISFYLVVFIILELIFWLTCHEMERSQVKAKRAADLLRQERDTLEIKVAERSRELEQLQAEQAIELYRFAEFGRLNSGLLHDLANPLTAVSLNFGELENSHDKDELISQIREGITNMEEYVESARRQLQSQRAAKLFDPNAEIRKVVRMQNACISNNRINCKLKLRRNLLIEGDRTKFVQLMANLITNAIDALGETKHSSHRQLIISTEKCKDQVLVKVIDNGPGIDRNEIKKIFKPFYSTKRNRKGMGIGLVIVSKIVREDFGGKLWVDSKIGSGTTFNATLHLEEKRS